MRYRAGSDCLGMVCSGWLLSEAPEVWPDIIVEKCFLVGRTKQPEKHHANAF